MNDDLLARRLRELADAPEPRPAFLDALHDELATELGLAERRGRADGASVIRPIDGSGRQAGTRRARHGHLRLLLAAMLVLAGTAATMVVGTQLLSPKPDLLTVLRTRGHLRAGVTSGYPQVVPRAGSPAGFDVDLVEQLAWGFGIDPQLIVLPPDQLVTDHGTWDLAVLPASQVRSGSDPVVISRPVLSWPVEVLVPTAAPAANLDDLRDARLCAVHESAGARWAEGRDPGATVVVAAPPVASILLLDTDAACLAALEAGRVDALVTDLLGPADLAMRPGLRSLAGPVLRVPRVVAIAADGPDPAALRSAVDAAIERMRADGTLRDLSLRRLGADLTSTDQP